MRNVSKKLAKELRVYSKMRIKYLQDRPICDVMTCDNWSSEVHHKKGRGKYLLDESTWMPVCRYCHKEIEENPLWAKEKGYSLNRLG
jgi:aspartate carbamoyltransferase regulatory subunit